MVAVLFVIIPMMPPARRMAVRVELLDDPGDELARNLKENKRMAIYLGYLLFSLVYLFISLSSLLCCFFCFFAYLLFCCLLLCCFCFSAFLLLCFLFLCFWSYLTCFLCCSAWLQVLLQLHEEQNQQHKQQEQQIQKEQREQQTKQEQQELQEKNEQLQRQPCPLQLFLFCCCVLSFVPLFWFLCVGLKTMM